MMTQLVPVQSCRKRMLSPSPRRRRNPLRRMSCTAMFSILSFSLSTTPGVNAHTITPAVHEQCKPSRTRQSKLHSVRGGANDEESEMDEQEAAELDAYIAQLLDEVEEEEKQTKATSKQKKVSAIAESSSSENTSSAPVTHAATQKATAISKESKIKTSTKKKSAKKKTVELAEKVKSSPKLEAETPNLELATTAQHETSQDNTTQVVEPDHAAVSPPPLQKSTQTRAPPPPPPNGLYRFLLRRAGGFGGRAMVLMLVTASEFLHTYVPPLAKAGDWVCAKFFPPLPGGARRKRTAAPLSTSVASVNRMARTGVSRKKRRKFTQQADQLALAQLKRQDASELRYAFCSLAFCQRHGLGKFASQATSTDPVQSMDGALVPAGETTLEHAPGLGTTNSKVRKKKQDWVLKALTKEPKHKGSPTLTLEAGSHGLTIGIELDWSGRKERVRAALTLPSSKRSKVSTKPHTSLRKSDANGGVLGRLRTAAGSSALRSWSGAYPGDALAVSEAGNPRGLGDFAAKYGYGDWSEESDEDIGLDTDGRRRRKKRRHITSESKRRKDTQISFSVDSSSSRRKLRRSSRSTSPEVALSSSPTLSNKRKRKVSFASSESESVRAEPDAASRERPSPAKTVARPQQVQLAKSPLVRKQDVLKKKSKRGSDEE